MNWQYVYVSPLYAAAVVSFTLALYARRHRSTQGASAFALLMAAAAEWALAYALSLISDGAALKLFWIKVRYLGIVIVPSAWLTFALLQTGRGKWVTQRNLTLLAIEPLCILLLVWTNEWHHLYWVDVMLKRVGPFTLIEATRGIFYWVHVVYSYLLIISGSVLFIQMVTRSPHLYRWQSLAVLFGAVGPFIGDVLSTFDLLSSLSWLDLTPFFFTLTGLAMTLAFFRFRLLDIVPVARDAVIESMSDGVLVLDAENRIVDINPVAEGIISRDVSEIIGQPAEQVLSQWPDLIERYRSVPETHTEISVGEGVARAYFDLRISPLRDWRSRLTGRLIVFRDVTKRKEMEKALQDAKEVAEAANRAKDEFISIVTHELRSPMSAIHGSATLLSDEGAGPVNENQAEFLEIIETNTRRMITLVMDLNDVSRIESGQLHLRPGTVSLAKVVEEVVRSTQPKIEEKAHTLSLQIADGLPPVWCDHIRLGQILTNLVNNACKFTPEGGEIAICAKCIADEGDSKTVCVSVQDNGLGIRHEDQKKIFQKFFRAMDKRVSEIPGSGLGLSITKSLVEMQGGRMWFESEYGRGSTFHFTVPVAEEKTVDV
ncbi:MAG: PAS domain-containing protein [Anaerolineae bacterium]|nr:PAS domain-containing protein [Anaerolineae bacterium]